MDKKSGAQISRKAFIQSLVILFILMVIAGILTIVIPSGQFTHTQVDGRASIDPNSFHYIPKPDYPVWQWFLAPIQVLGSEAGITIIVIIIVLFFAGGAFAVLDKTGTLLAFIERVINRFKGRKYLLLWMVALAFMLLGATLGIFEEVILLVPLMIAFSYSLGWDALVGLGLSVLATNMGFSAAVSNPFTLGVAQQLAGLPIFSGAWFHVIIFAVIYLIFTTFLYLYAKKIDRDPKSSLVYKEDQVERAKYSRQEIPVEAPDRRQNRAMAFFGVFVLLILVDMLAAPFIPAISDFSLPLVGILFLIGGLGAGFISGAGGKAVWSGLKDGMIGILPAVPLILMASSIRFILDSGQVTDTILHAAAAPLSTLGAMPAAIVIYVLALGVEFFIGSGSAKAFLLMPIILPLADLVGLTRQTAVLAYIFGDGFSNMAYPTNPVLLISLGLTMVSYPKWFRWTAKLWLLIILASVVFLGIAVVIGYGPF
jgi:uncharacterized ion transporter superfamily protein YfcC